MFLRTIIIFSVLWTCLIWTGTASATILSNPDNTIYADDIDGDGYFSSNLAFMIAWEIYDSQESLTGSTFGFFYENDPTTLIPLFDSADATGQTAIVDFSGGYVLDFDELAVQSIFTHHTSDIGFFLFQDGFSAPLYSNPFFNDGLTDIFGAFPVLATDDSILFTWLLPDDTTLAWEIVRFTSVPEPNTILLFGSGILGLAYVQKKRRRL
jgi:hypothetical protein